MSKQVTQIAAIADSDGSIIKPAGVRITRHEDGGITEEKRRDLGDGTVEVVTKNVIAGTADTNVVAAEELEAI